MRITKEQVVALQEFGEGFGAANKSLARPKLVELVRREARDVFRRIGLTGNHGDRQIFKDIAMNAAIAEGDMVPTQTAEEPAVGACPPDREPGVPDMQVINGTPWLGLV